MKKLIVVLAILAVVVVAAVGVWRVNQKKHQVADKTTKDVQMQQGFPVEVTPAAKTSIDLMQPVYGMLKGRNEVPIVPKVGGRVAAIYVDNGSKVHKGQPLVQLETKEIMDNVNQAQAAVNGARERLILTRKGARPQERSQAENMVEQAKQAFEVAKSNLDRMNKLLNSGVISQQTFDSVKLQFDMAKAQYDNAKEQLSIVHVGARDEEKKMAEEGLKQAEAALSFAKEQIKNATIVSPISGVVTSKFLELGQLTGPTTQYPLMTIVDDSEFVVNADISEVDLYKVTVGQLAELSVDAVPDEKFMGRVTKINPAASMGARTYKIEIRLKDSKRLLKSGLFARGNVFLEKHDGVITVPKDALIKRGGKDGVFVVEGDKAVLRAVKTGITNPDAVELLSGVSDGERVVTAGAAGLNDGDKVKVVKRVSDI